MSVKVSKTGEISLKKNKKSFSEAKTVRVKNYNVISESPEH